MDAPTVRLVDLEVIKQFSLAVRAEWAPAADVLAALNASRDAVLEVIGAGSGAAPASSQSASRKKAAAAKKPAAKRSAKAPAAKAAAAAKKA